MNWPALEFIGEWGWLGGMVLAAVAGMLAAGVYYLEVRRNRSKFLRFGLPAMRGLAVFLIVMMLPRAVLTYRWTVGDMAKVVVFVDNSKSMGLRDDAMSVDRKLMIARELGDLKSELFDEDLGAAVERLESARDVAARLDPTAAGLTFHTGVREFATEMDEVFASLKKVGPGIWPEAGARRVEFAAEVVEPSNDIARQVMGIDPRTSHRDLMSILSVAARWGDVLEAAWKLHVKAISQQGIQETLDAEKAVSARTRMQRLSKYLFRPDDGLIGRLTDSHEVELVYMNGSKPEAFWDGSPEMEREDRRIPERFKSSPTNNLSNLSAPIRDRLGSIEVSNQLAVVVLTDGQHNSGNAPLELAALFGQEGVAIYPVGVGMTERPTDIAILDVVAEENVAEEGRVRGEIVLKDDMREGIRFPVRVQHQGTTLWTTNLDTKMSGIRRIAFDFPAKELAQKVARSSVGLKYSARPIKLKATAGRLSEDKDPSNNSANFRIAMGSQKPKVLLVDGRPRWEFRYLRNLFSRDDNWLVNVLLTGAGGQNTKLPRGKGLGTFPADQETMNSYDLIILGDVAFSQFTPIELNMFVNFVSERGGGLVMVDGRRERLGTYARSPMAILFPVRFRPGFPVFERMPMKFSVPGFADLLSPMNLTGDGERNKILWNSIPGPHWVNQVTAQPGTETLAELVYGPNRIPALVTHRVGSGRVLYMGFDESWRWRYNVGDLYHQRFWNQIGNWIMEPPFQVKDDFVAMDTGKLRYETGETADIRIRPLKETLKRVANPIVSLILERDGLPAATILLEPDSGGSGVYRGETSKLSDGEYKARVKIDGVLDSLIQATTSFSVGPRSRMEMAQLHCNEGLLREIARESGGKYFPEEKIDLLISQLEPLSRGTIMEKQIALWNSYWWFVPIILLLGVEWFFRKKSGLV